MSVKTVLYKVVVTCRNNTVKTYPVLFEPDSEKWV